MISFYIHIPFCLRKCGYCDFYSVCNYDDKVFKAYFNALVKQYDYFKNKKYFSSEDEVYTIFFGGGTPSILPSEYVSKIIEIIDPKKQAVEITIEANPDTIDFEYLKELKKARVNRLSIGVQSFDKNVLNTLDRTHNPINVELAVEFAKKLDLNFSLDLIYGTPGESLLSWENTVKKVVELKPNHISAYALTLENNVPMALKIKSGLIGEIDTDQQAQKYQIVDEILSQNGYEWYEISNWRKIDNNSKNNTSLHNLMYWQNGNWIGLGPSSHSHIKKEDEFRFWYENSIRNFIENPQNIDIEYLEDCEILLEKILLASRLKQNIKDVLALDSQIVNTLLEQSFINEKYELTLKGRMLNDQLIQKIDQYLTQKSDNISTFKSKKICDRYLTQRCLSCPQCIM